MSVTEKSRCLIEKSNRGSCCLSLMFEVVQATLATLDFWSCHSWFVCLFVWVDKTRAVKPLRRFHSWTLSFTQDGPALFVCLFVWINPENLYFVPCVWMEVITPGNGCTRNQAQKLSFTQDGLAFSTKTARRTLQDHVRDTKSTVLQI